MIAVLLALVTTFTPMHTRNEPSVLLQGIFESCPDGDDGAFGERAFPYVVKGRTLFVLHLGPADEFAIFAGPLPDEHQDHNTPDNFLFPAYHVTALPTLRGDRNWSVGSLHVHLSVVRAGGSNPECESFYVRLTQIPVRYALWQD